MLTLIRKVFGMAGKFPITASDEQRAAPLALADSRNRGQADRARAVLLTLAGWTSPKIAEAVGVRESTVRLWRSDFAVGGVAALKASIAPGPRFGLLFAQSQAQANPFHLAFRLTSLQRVPGPPPAKPFFAKPWTVASG
jgi:hypothetical protein